MKQDLFHSALCAQELSNILADLMLREFEWAEAYDRADAVKAKGRASLVAAIEDWQKSHS